MSRINIGNIETIPILTLNYTHPLSANYESLKEDLSTYNNIKINHNHNEIFEINTKINSISIKNFKSENLKKNYFLNNTKNNIISISFHDNTFLKNKLKLFLNEKEKINLFNGYIRNLKSLYIPNEIINMIFKYWIYGTKYKLTSKNTAFEYIRIYTNISNQYPLPTRIQEIDNNTFFGKNLTKRQCRIYFEFIEKYKYLENLKPKKSFNIFKTDLENCILFEGNKYLNLKNIYRKNSTYFDVIRLIIRGRLALVLNLNKENKSFINKLNYIFS